MTDSMNIVESVLEKRGKEVCNQNMDYWDLDKTLQAHQNSQSPKLINHTAPTIPNSENNYAKETQWFFN